MVSSPNPNTFPPMARAPRLTLGVRHYRISDDILVLILEYLEPADLVKACKASDLSSLQHLEVNSNILDVCYRLTTAYLPSLGTISLSATSLSLPFPA